MSHPPAIEIVALGGLGEIGMNCMAYACGDELFIVDCGLLFPDESMLGVDLVIPDFTWLRENRERFRAAVITHGHEDHIGALAFLLQEFEVPVYATRFTLGLIRNRLREVGLDETADLHEIVPGARIEIGPFSIEPIHVTHSICDAVSLAIDTPRGTLIHTADFKIDPTPVDGRPMDLPAFARYGDRGVLALLSDSTNVERAGYTISEQRVGHTITEIMREHTGRVIVSTFASNVHRLQQVIDAAESCGRKIAIDGRSMIENVALAEDLGYIAMPEGLAIKPKEAAIYPDREVAILTTGSQGEPLSALVRMAHDNHKHLEIREGDLVILSSRFIPGNERAINQLINLIYRKGGEVVYERVSEVHVSGHAYREELKMMLALTRPRYFIPIHGEYRHLSKHAALARSMGIPEAHTLVAVNGDRVQLDERGLHRDGPVEVGRVFVDGKGIGDVGDIVLRDRRHLSEGGLLIAVLTIEKGGGRIVGEPEFFSRGFVYQDHEDSEALFADLREYLLEDIAALPHDVRTDLGEFKESVRRALSRFIKKKLARRPLIIPVVMEA